MLRSSLVSRVATLSGLLLLAGCSKEIDFSIPASFPVNSSAGVQYSTVQQVDLAVDAPDAWSHKDKVKDLTLVDIEGTVVSIVTSPTTGSGTVALRLDTATSSSGDVTIGTYTNQAISLGSSVTVTLAPGALDIINDALQGNGRFKVVASGTTLDDASFEVEFTLHLKLNYKII